MKVNFHSSFSLSLSSALLPSASLITSGGNVKKASLVFESFKEIFWMEISAKLVRYKLQFWKDVFTKLARINLELYKSESSKEDWYDCIPQKLFWTNSESVNKTWENFEPAKETNCKFDLIKLQSEKVEKSKVEILERKCSVWIFVKVQWCM